MIEYKQNYPILLEENKQLKGDNRRFIEEKEAFERDTDKLMEKIS